MTPAALTAASLVARWAHLYSDSKGVSTTVTFLHFASMLVGGGFALVADWEAFRLSPNAPSDLPRELATMERVHPWVLGGLGVVIVTGLLMMLADLSTYLGSVAFWTKIGLFVLLLANGYGRIRSEAAIARGAARGWTWLRRTSLASAALWLAVLLVSTILTVSS